MIAVFVARSGAVAFGDGVQSLCGGGDVAQLRKHLVALTQQFDSAVALGAGCGCGGEVVFGALDGGAGLAAPGVDGAKVLGVGQVVGEHGDQGVPGLSITGGGDQYEFGVGVRGGVGEPVQLCGGEGVGVVDDDQAAQWSRVALGGEVGAVVVDAGGGVGVGALGGAVGAGQRNAVLVVVVCGVGEGVQGGRFVGTGMQVEQLDAVNVGGQRVNGAAMRVVEAVEGARRGCVEGGGAGGAGRVQEVDFGRKLVEIGAQIVSVGRGLGERAGGGGFGAGELVIKVAGAAAGDVEGVGVGAHGVGAPRMQVVFGDDAGQAAGGVDEVGARNLEALAGGAPWPRRGRFVR